MMNSLSTSHDSYDAPPAAVDPASANADAASSHDEQNPLWLIAAGMALFFAVAAAFLTAG
jgi:hypothetical protein